MHGELQLMEVKTKFSKKVMKLRKELGWSQTDVARRAGCTSATISIIEKGERKPSLAMASRIDKAFNIPVSQLTDEEKITSSEYSDKFYLRFAEIDDLSKPDQKFIMDMVKKLKKESKK
jgi:transcriptional regulator with XRE-family HTH domain